VSVCDDKNNNNNKNTTLHVCMSLCLLMINKNQKTKIQTVSVGRIDLGAKSQRQKLVASWLVSHVQ
jgi:hypothetical protein